MRLSDIKRSRPLSFEDARRVLSNASSTTNDGWSGLHVELKEDLYVFKQAHYWRDYGNWGTSRKEKVIVNLIIPAHSKVFLGREYGQGVSYKARASRAFVHSIATFDGIGRDLAYSIYSSIYKYKPGGSARPSFGFSESFKTCASGIHFFLDIGSALNYVSW